MKATPKDFNEVRNFLDGIPFINNGGCGISALAMYKWLKKNKLDVDCKFVALYENNQEECYENNCRVLRTKKGNAMAMSHMAICNAGVTMDSSEILSIDRWKIVQFFDAEWFMVNMLNNRGSWNNLFDRSFMREIEEVLEISLEEIVD